MRPLCTASVEAHANTVALYQFFETERNPYVHIFIHTLTAAKKSHIRCMLKVKLCWTFHDFKTWAGRFPELHIPEHVSIYIMTGWMVISWDYIEPLHNTMLRRLCYAWLLLSTHPYHVCTFTLHSAWSLHGVIWTCATLGWVAVTRKMKVIWKGFLFSSLYDSQGCSQRPTQRLILQPIK